VAARPSSSTTTGSGSQDTSTRAAPILRGIAVDGDHGRDRLAHGANDVARQHRPFRLTADLDVRGVRSHRGDIGQIGFGDHGAHAGSVGGPGRVHGNEAGMSVRRAHECDVKRAHQADIVYVASLPADWARILDALHPLADVFAPRGQGRRVTKAFTIEPK
jgi:hypothetical protein